jgi:hypothetical protein
MKKHYWLILAIIIVAGLWLDAEAERWRLRHEITSVYLGEVTIQAVDANTKSPVKIVFRGPSTTLNQRWPKSFTMSTTDDLSKMLIRWIDVGDVNVEVSAEGYEAVPLTLNKTTSGNLAVPLQRSAGSDPPNAPPAPVDATAGESVP